MIQKNKIIGLCFIFLAILFLTKTFIIDCYTIQGDSMMDQYNNGDKVWVLKNGRVSALSIPWKSDNNNLILFKNTAQALPHNTYAFYNPFHYNQATIKNCIAKAGDTIKISDNNIFINQKPYSLRKYLQAFEITDTRGIINEKIMSDFNLKGQPMDKNHRHWTLFGQADKLTQLKENLDITIQTNIGLQFPDTLFIVPYKGMKVVLNATNAYGYRNIFDFENTDAFKQDGVPHGEYEIKEDYFFALGNHLYESKDSRYYGPFPSSRLIGKVL